MGADADQCGSLAELAAHYVAAVRAVQPAGPYLLLGASMAGSALAHAMACALERAGERAVLVLLDGSVGAPAGTQLHDATWYALFYLLREIGTFAGTMGEFVDFVRADPSPTQQLKLLNSFKPAELVNEDGWHAAVYTTLDRATALRRLLRAAYASAPAPAAGAGQGAAAPANEEVFGGPAAMLVPSGRLGQQFVEASRQRLGGGGVVQLQLDCRHTECVLGDRALQATALQVVDAIRLLLQRIQ